jgi:hypothetical protein
LFGALPVEGERVAVLALDVAFGWELTDGSRPVAGVCVTGLAVRNVERNGIARLKCVSVTKGIRRENQRTMPVPLMAKIFSAEAVLRKVAPARRRVLAANCILMVG